MVADGVVFQPLAGSFNTRQATGKDLPSTTTKLKPRSGVTAQWTFEMDEIF
jgi:hypothetical protein